MTSTDPIGHLLYFYVLNNTFSSHKIWDRVWKYFFLLLWHLLHLKCNGYPLPFYCIKRKEKHPINLFHIIHRFINFSVLHWTSYGKFSSSELTSNSSVYISLYKAVSTSYSSRWFYLRDFRKLTVTTLYIFLNLQIILVPWARFPPSSLLRRPGRLRNYTSLKPYNVNVLLHCLTLHLCILNILSHTDLSQASHSLVWQRLIKQ